jgi:hypothetical protein
MEPVVVPVIDEGADCRDELSTEVNEPRRMESYDRAKLMVGFG